MLPLRDDYGLEAESRFSPDALRDLVRTGIPYKPLPGLDVHTGSFQAAWRDLRLAPCPPTPIRGG